MWDAVVQTRLWTTFAVLADDNSVDGTEELAETETVCDVGQEETEVVAMLVVGLNNFHQCYCHSYHWRSSDAEMGCC